MKAPYAVMLLTLVLGPSAQAQMDTLWLNTANGMSTTVYNTPFANETGQAGRTGYLYRSETIVNAGMLPSEEILGICLQVVDDDVVVPACLMDLHLQLKNTTMPDLLDFEYTGLMHTVSIADINLSSGLLCLTFDTPFLWMGEGFNVYVDLSFERGADAGLAPRIMLETGLPYTATRSGTVDYAMNGMYLTSLTPGADLGTDASLPALGLMKSFAQNIQESEDAALVTLAPNPVDERFSFSCDRPIDRILILNAYGQLMVDERVTTASATLDVEYLAPGCYSVSFVKEGDTIATRTLVKR